MFVRPYRALANLCLLAASLLCWAGSASAQQTLSTEYGQPQTMDPAAMPLVFSVQGWGAQAFTRATKSIGRFSGATEGNVIERFNGNFNRAGWAGNITLVDSHSLQITWNQTTATATANGIPYIRDHQPALRDAGTVLRGRMEVRYIVADVTDNGTPRSCVSFSSGLENWYLTGLVCGPVNLSLDKAMARDIIGGIGYPDAFSAVPVALMIQ